MLEAHQGNMFLTLKMERLLILLIIYLSSANIFQAKSTEEGRSYTTFKDELENPSSRRAKLFPVFQIVTFPNDACASGTRNGTCYTSEECAARSGTSSGSCANGYGVCCIFSRTCGQMTTENCTYFTSPTTVPTTSDCVLQVCPCGNNICQIRLDFNTFVITGPSTSSASVGRAINGDLVKSTGGVNAAAPQVSSNGQCLTDIFSVTSPGNAVPPNVCGTLTNEHMYADLNNGCCDELRFSLSDNVNGGAATVTRSWDIKVTQYSCDYNNLAPAGCTKYFFGSSTGMFNNYHFGNQHLADQNELICVRREQGFCRICYVPTAAADFQLSGPTGFAAITKIEVDDTEFCCGYGPSGSLTNGFDCIEIPGVTGLQGNINGGTVGTNDPINSRFCGRSLGFQSAARTVCTSQTPFSVRFRSDRFEFVKDGVNGATSEGSAPDNGFRLAYTMDTTMCN